MFISDGLNAVFYETAEFCRQERKIIKAHYMLAYECGLRRLRSRPRRPIIGIAGVTKNIEARGVYLGVFTIINHPPSFLIN